MWAQQVVSWTVVLLYFVTVAGIVARRRTGICVMFVAYLFTLAVTDLMMLVWPDTFHQQWFWFGRELAVNVLRFAFALELTWWTFRAFPSARSSARGVLLAVLLLTLGIVWWGTANLEPSAGAPVLGPLISRVQAMVVNGAIWLLTGIAGLILWYRLPVRPFHKAILVAMVPYLFVYSVVLNLLESRGWALRESLNLPLTGAYLLVIGYWAWAAWRPSEAPVQAPPLVPDPGPSLDGSAG